MYIIPIVCVTYLWYMRYANIYARKRAFTHRYAIVKLNHLTAGVPLGEYATRSFSGGVSPLPPANSKIPSQTRGEKQKRGRVYAQNRVES